MTRVYDFSFGTAVLRVLQVIALIYAIACGVSRGQDVADNSPPPPEQVEEDDSFGACEAVENGAIFKPLSDIKTILASDKELLPPDCSESFFTEQLAGDSPRFSMQMAYNWEPTNFFHMPTYFDDVPLERYGQHRHPVLQPFISGTRFALQLPVLPYKMGVDRPHACITTLGHRPPGDCVPCIRQRIPIEADAAALQAAATVGLVFLLP